MSYSIKDGLLFKDGRQIEFFPSPNTSGKITPKFLVIHFTAGAVGAIGTAKYFQKPEAKTSAHLMLDENGSWAQGVAFDVKAWHAGKSSWAGYTGLNSHSIGIEVCNPGPLTKTASGSYKTWWGKEIDSADVIEGPHPNDPTGPVYGWVPFTSAQVNAIIEVGQLLMQEYNLQECVGHDMIAPGRKSDPGMCMDRRVYDMINDTRGDEEEYVWTVANVNEYLNGRAGPGTNHAVVKTLPVGTPVEVLHRQGLWWFVDTPDGQDVWVHSKFLATRKA